MNPHGRDGTGDGDGLGHGFLVVQIIIVRQMGNLEAVQVGI